MNSVSG